MLMPDPVSDVLCNRYYVLQLDPYTGVLLTLSGEWASAGDGHRYTFESLHEAEDFCAEQLRGRPETEWWIYDGSGAVVRGFRDDNYWANLPLQRPRAGFWQRFKARLQ
jgi:hypothetical protein